MKLLRRTLAATILAIAAFGFALPASGDDALPSAPRRWATDSAGFLSAGAREALDNRLEQYERSTGHQILVWITNTSGNFTPEDFSSKAFAAWRVGRRGIDDGVVLFVFADDRKLRFEVGYGLEATVTDSKSGAILRDVVVPRIQAGDRDGAITQGIEALIATIDGTASPDGGGTSTGSSPDSQTPSAAQDEPSQGSRRQLSTGEKIVIGLLVIGFIILLITNPSLALWLLFNLLSGGRGGGGGGGGGGFSGGGGRSGGGGASGSW